ncbi:MAG: dipeptidase [Melioribacteraceae bacterium]|nr:dipeptidase [Melioribacteraceae bacterium]MCF8353852.1 dipeptidase [Melioribacteraceae bacterium]MCF8393085.1 dipeptidase [Melioribacteraceae bacterium]MCF8419204.1 dipeptidase [Melioribacteraceae bacterium]
MKKLYILVLIILVSCQTKESTEEMSKAITKEYAKELAHKFLLVDTHVDLPYRMRDNFEDISQLTKEGHTDYPRMIEGGLNAPFMSIYIPASYQKSGRAKLLADTLINMVEGFEERWSNKFKIAKTTSDVRKNFADGIISLPMGIENGAAIEDDLSNLKHFYDRGIRYITLTHSKNNLIGGSSYDTERTWDGLTEYGEEVIKEMNRLGIMVDVSHVSDSTFWDIMNVTGAPPIASHSSCRHFTPGMERNMSDEMIKALAEKDGVIMINFGSYFLNSDFQKKMDGAWDYLSKNNIKGEERIEWLENYKKENQVKEIDIKEVAAHIKHVVNLVGIEHVGLGSDFDGVGDLPAGLTDVSMYPNLIFELLKKGFSENDIQKICSGNIMRVWRETEKFASQY